MTDENAKVVGHQTDADGETYGVKGSVDSEDGYGLYTPDDAKIEGVVESTDEFTIETASTDGADAGNVVLGDPSNDAGGSVEGATVSGGEGNEASHEHATVSGGEGNKASGRKSTVGGGVNNVASGRLSTVAGGSGNHATHNRATIGGGLENFADNHSSTVSGGVGHNDPGDSEFQAGDASTIGGGYWNVAGGTDGDGFNRNQTVAGGRENEATAQEATVNGGLENAARGRRATVPGGMDNVADGNYSFAAGRNATATHQGSFVVGDSTSSEVVSQTSNEARFQMDTRVEGDVTVNDGGNSTFSYVRFGADDGSSPRMFYSNSSRAFSLTDADEFRLFMDLRTTGDVKPYTDDGGSLGTSGDRWTDVWAVNGTIQTSDARLKTNVSDLSDGLDRVQALRPVSFEWKDDGDGDGDGSEREGNLGLLAQEVEDVVPEAVTRPDDDGYLGLNYQAVVPVLIEAVQEQQRIIEDLQEERERIADRAEKREGGGADRDREIDDLEVLETETDELREENGTLREANDELRDRLSAIETHVGIDTGQRGAADD